MKDSSLDTVGDSGADPVPLRELVKGLHHSEMQTSELREQLSSWSLISGFIGWGHLWPRGENITLNLKSQSLTSGMCWFEPALDLCSVRKFSS